MHSRPLSWTLLALISLTIGIGTATADSRGLILADFESGSVSLRSYDTEQDQDPNAWELTDHNTYGGSDYSLRLYGNTWKAQAIAPHQISHETVFSVAAYIDEIGEMQAFGISDGVNVLFYTFSGSQLPTGESWEVEYQGAFPTRQWNLYYLPVGRDWNARYGYYPDIVDLIYVNDRDDTNDGETIFDDIIDVTSDLPVAPEATILQGRQRVQKLSERLYRVGIQFHADVYDPDSDTFLYHWDFGDSTFSSEADPYHNFLVEADYTYTVTLSVQDETDLWGRDSAQVTVEPGEPEGPCTMNFAGDVMLARRYEQPGGAIYEYGVEAVFEPTLPILGDAADISIINLESPLTDEGDPHPTKSYVFRGRPENVAGLTYAGIDVVSIGNNHIIDYGQRGMEETQEVLDAAEILWSGAGDNEYIALQPTIWTEDGVAVAFLGQCNRTGREWNYQPFLDAAYNKPGMAYHIEPNVTDAIAAVRNLVDLVVMQVHSGQEYSTGPGTKVGGLPEPLFDAPGPVRGDPDFTFPTRPSLTDRQLRWRAVEAGADIVICHHPHVLQGFEVYLGVLIAHSMGNFAFDQSYVETFPSMVIQTEFDKTGIVSHQYLPVFIEGMIPRPVTGRLGREILDRVADYSRELATVASVNPVSSVGTIHLDPGLAGWAEAIHERSAQIRGEDGMWLSLPIEHDGLGTLSQVVSVDGPGYAEVRLGRELLWHGDFEDEGATLWNLNSGDEEFDETVFHQGARSLRQHRDPQNQGPVTTDLEGNPPTLGSNQYTVSGWIKTENAREAGIFARLYESRWGGQIASVEAGDLMSGTQDWTWHCNSFEIGGDANYFNVACRAERPSSGDAYMWYDEVRLVEWEEWLDASSAVPVDYPNNYRFMQVRLTEEADSVSVTWAEMIPAELVSQVPEGPTPVLAAAGIRRSQPNPFNARTTIEYLLPKAGKVRLSVFDISGRRVAVLDDGVKTAGHHRVDWEAREFVSGLYLCRLETAGKVWTKKLVLLK